MLTLLSLLLASEFPFVNLIYRNVRPVGCSTKYIIVQCLSMPPKRKKEKKKNENIQIIFILKICQNKIVWWAFSTFYVRNCGTDSATMRPGFCLFFLLNTPSQWFIWKYTDAVCFGNLFVQLRCVWKKLRKLVNPQDVFTNIFYLI